MLTINNLFIGTDIVEIERIKNSIDKYGLKFIEKIHSSESPFFIIIWDGSPHDPFLASEEDKKQFDPEEVYKGQINPTKI